MHSLIVYLGVYQVSSLSVRNFTKINNSYEVILQERRSQRFAIL
ncbi:hypothetical protein [Nostoc sp. UHCC 0870]|nr:hypothetical protein [Nostoc sp. UHCC 0870]